MKFAVMGGDARLAQLCRLLHADGHRVRTFALERADKLDEAVASADCAECARHADCVILPLPLSGRQGYLSTLLSAREVTLDEVFSSLPRGVPVCAGRVDDYAAECAKKYGVGLIDYFCREELCVMNAAATAEGALELLIRETPKTLLGSRVLVVGFGRIGRLLALRLQGMGCHVAVSSRKYADMAWCRAMGFEPLDTRALEPHLGKFDMVVNTVPAAVLGEERLRLLREGSLCMDLASRPGGVDFAAAARLGVHAIWALSLPGEVAPISAGEIIRDTIYNILREQELM
ncbi:MAG: dipicolinate synthase subunit DpsA [Candidatus Heteroscillospira sp.]|jgi:dipicolinate synthase subunit A